MKRLLFFMAIATTLFANDSASNEVVLLIESDLNDNVERIIEIRTNAGLDIQMRRAMYEHFKISGAEAESAMRLNLFLGFGVGSLRLSGGVSGLPWLIAESAGVLTLAGSIASFANSGGALGTQTLSVYGMILGGGVMLLSRFFSMLDVSLYRDRYNASLRLALEPFGNEEEEDVTGFRAISVRYAVVRW